MYRSVVNYLTSKHFRTLILINYSSALPVIPQQPQGMMHISIRHGQHKQSTWLSVAPYHFRNNLIDWTNLTSWAVTVFIVASYSSYSLFFSYFTNQIQIYRKVAINILHNDSITFRRRQNDDRIMRLTSIIPFSSWESVWLVKHPIEISTVHTRKDVNLVNWFLFKASSNSY